LSRSLVATLLPVVLFAALGTATPVPTHLMKPVPYHPTAVGTKWVYEDDGADTSTYAVSDAAAGAGGTVVTVVEVVDGRACPWQKVLVSAAGITRIELFGTPLDPPDALLRLPAKAGDSWETEAIGKVGGRWDPIRRQREEDITLVGKRTAGKVERVVVPAGTFTAIRVESEVAINGRARRTTNWYAPGVGLVKLAYGDSAKVLKSFTPGKE
jgi:DUF3108-like